MTSGGPGKVGTTSRGVYVPYCHMYSSGEKGSEKMKILFLFSFGCKSASTCIPGAQKDAEGQKLSGVNVEAILIALVKNINSIVKGSVLQHRLIYMPVRNYKRF